MTDQFATVTVMTRDEMDRNTGLTLGEMLQSKPGITSSGFAPGAASRPIIRGLDNYRVRIQENGLSSSGVSELGEDHAVPIDPLAAQSVEVIRGPATLRYGSQAIGGVVNAENNRIPTVIPPRGFSGELRSAITTVDRGREGAVLLDAGGGNFAIHADAFGRSNGRLQDSVLSLSLSGCAGAGRRSLAAEFRQSNRRRFGRRLLCVRSRLHRHRGLDLREPLPRARSGRHAAIRASTSSRPRSRAKARSVPTAMPSKRCASGSVSTDYRHDEIGNEGGFDGVQQTFTSRQKEGRAEIQFRPVDLRFSTLTSALGVQGFAENLDAPGVAGRACSIPTPPAASPATCSTSSRFNATQRMQIAGRIEQNVVKGSVPDLFVDPKVSIARDLAFTPKSAALGFLQDLPGDLVASATAQYVERAPRAPELLSRGVHDATGTFDIGDPNLQTEVAKSVEIGLRRNKGPWRFELTGFYTRFDGFIFRNLTGQTCDDDFCKLRAWKCRRGETGGLFAARRHLPRRRIPDPV